MRERLQSDVEVVLGLYTDSNVLDADTFDDSLGDYLACSIRRFDFMR